MQNNPAIRSLLSIFFPLFHQLLEWLLAAVGVYGSTLADVNATSSLQMAGYVMSRMLLVGNLCTSVYGAFLSVSGQVDSGAGTIGAAPAAAWLACDSLLPAHQCGWNAE